LLEVPQRRTFFSGIPFLLIAEHLHLPVEVMRQYPRGGRPGCRPFYEWGRSQSASAT
jgi:hypothetical protein